MDSIKDQPRSDEFPSVVFKFRTMEDRDDFCVAMRHVEQDAAPPRGSRIMGAEQAIRSVLMWGVE